MNSSKYFISFLFLIIPLLGFSQANSIINSIALNDSIEEVMNKIIPIAENQEVFNISSPIFPLAEVHEAHLVASNINTTNGILEKAVFTFADQQLVCIQAFGNVKEVFTKNTTEEATNYLDYKFYSNQNLIISAKQDIAWILTPEAMHINLFSWEHPLLKTPAKDIYISKTFKIPAFLKMGASLDELQPILEANSKFTSLEELDGSDPNAQQQLNCFGVEYLGFPRKVEARFGNNALNVVWILTAKGEEQRIRKALIEEYGAPIYVTNAWEIFNNWQVGLRKDKPEILLMEQNIGLQYKSSYFKQ